MSFDTPPPPPGFNAQPPQGSPNSDKTMALLAHGLGILFGFFAPLIILFASSNASAYVRRNATEALNFQITLLIAGFVSFILIIVGIGIVLLALLGIIGIALPIVAMVRVNEGVDFRYPAILRLVK